MAKQDSGNTSSLRLEGKAVAYQFTINQTSTWPVLEGLLGSLKSCDYVVACHERAPSTGHEHIHCYAHFKTPYKLSKHFWEHGWHIEKCRGSPQQNIAYIKKDGDVIYERGTAPAIGRPTTCGELKQLNINDVPPNMLNSWMKLQTTKIKKDEWHKDVEVIYISGPSGSGKSMKAHELADDEFDEVKFINGFWSPCTGEGCCIYDDFRPSHMSASEFINFIDYNTHVMNIKGGSVRNHYNKIIITSIIPLDQLYERMPVEAREQWMRRVTWINVTEAVAMIAPSHC